MRWNATFSRNPPEPAFVARGTTAKKDARRLAGELITIDHGQFRTAFRKSPMRRAKLTELLGTTGGAFEKRLKR